MAEFAATITALGDQLASLKVLEAVQLKDYLKEKYNIEPAGGGVMMAAPTGVGGAAVAEKPAEVTDFQVILDGLTDPSKKINVIKEVRAITNLGLKEAKDLVEGAPKPVKETAPKDEANSIKKKLEDAGAKVSLKPAG
jgi:large subunit ribosomal protein L7/L12